MGEIFAAVAVVVAEVPKEKKRQRFKSLTEMNASGFPSPPCPLPHRFLVWPCARPNKNWKSHKKTASYIYAGYKFVPYISGRLSLFLDPSEVVSLSSSLDAQGEKMSWRLKKKNW